VNHAAVAGRGLLADLAVALDDGDRVAAAREHGGAGQPDGACTDHDHVNVFQSSISGSQLCMVAIS
jgi:hypothetical protein